MEFKQWLVENELRTAVKLGNYPSAYTALGFYPPLYLSPRAADFVTYFNMAYPKGVPTKNGIVNSELIDSPEDIVRPG